MFPNKPSAPSPASTRKSPVFAALGLSAAVIACSIYANLSYAITDPAGFRWFPPLQSRVNANGNKHLETSEYFHIARALAAGEGFSHPFARPSGPTAWMPPVLPLILAGLYRLGGSEGLAAPLGD